MKNRIKIFITGTTNVGKSTIANSLTGTNMSEVSASPETTISTNHKLIIFDEKIEVHFYDLIAIGGISNIKVDSILELMRRGKNISYLAKNKIIPGKRSPLIKKMMKMKKKFWNIRGKSIILFVFDIVSGYKREDRALLTALIDMFSKTKIIIVANRADSLKTIKIKKIIDHCKFPSNLNIISCSRTQIDVDKLSLEIVKVII